MVSGSGRGWQRLNFSSRASASTGSWPAQFQPCSLCTHDQAGHEAAVERFSVQKSLQLIAWSCCRMFDRSGKGSIDLEAFARLHQFLMQMQESFRYFDTERRGSLSFTAVNQALQHAGGVQLRFPSCILTVAFGCSLGCQRYSRSYARLEKSSFEHAHPMYSVLFGWSP